LEQLVLNGALKPVNELVRNQDIVTGGTIEIEPTMFIHCDLSASVFSRDFNFLLKLHLLVVLELLDPVVDLCIQDFDSILNQDVSCCEEEEKEVLVLESSQLTHH